MSSNEVTYTVSEKPAEPQTLFINEVAMVTGNANALRHLGGLA